MSAVVAGRTPLRKGLPFAAFLVLGACSVFRPDPPVPPEERPIPEAVYSLAAPNQDLSSVRLLPRDGCYWYMHRGVVEDTLLPLRANSGTQICLQSQA